MVTRVAPVKHDPHILLARIRELESRLKISEARCGKLEYKLQDLLRRIYSHKSEKLNPAQWTPRTEESAGSASSARRRRGGGQRRAPENLPVKREVVDLPEEQKAGLIKIREEITEQIEYQPSRFYRLQIIRPVYASRTRAHAPIIAALPAQVIPQAGVGPGFITHVVIAKYVDALPLYRQERIDARGGVWISRQARCRYVEAAAYLLITIHQHLKRKILDGGYVQVDETSPNCSTRTEAVERAMLIYGGIMRLTSAPSCWSSPRRVVGRSCTASFHTDGEARCRPMAPRCIRASSNITPALYTSSALRTCDDTYWRR
jgi:transposase